MLILDRIKFDKPEVDKSSQLLAESVNGITKTCMLIEKIEIENKKSLRHFEQTERRINSLELELRNQGDFASTLKIENEELSKFQPPPGPYRITKKIEN